MIGARDVIILICSKPCSANEPYMKLPSQNKNGGDTWGTLYREPMGRLVLRCKKSKNHSGEAYIQSSNTNSPGIIKTSQKIERLSKHLH